MPSVASTLRLLIIEPSVAAPGGTVAESRGASPCGVDVDEQATAINTIAAEAARQIIPSTSFGTAWLLCQSCKSLPWQDDRNRSDMAPGAEFVTTKRRPRPESGEIYWI